MDRSITISGCIWRKDTPLAKLFIIRGEEHFIPKSQIQRWDDLDGILVIPLWLARKRGLDRLDEPRPEPENQSLVLNSDDLPESSALYRKLAQKWHPDKKSGNAEFMTDLNSYREAILRDLRGHCP